MKQVMARLTAAALLLLAPVAAIAQTGYNPGIPISRTNPLPVTNPDGTPIGGGGSVAIAHTNYTLLTGATSAPTQTLAADTYAYSWPTAFNGATLHVTITDPGGNVTTTDYTAPPATATGIGSYGLTTISVTATGGTPTGTFIASGGAPSLWASVPLATYTFLPAATSTRQTGTVTSSAVTPATGTASFSGGTATVKLLNTQLARPIGAMGTGTWTGTVYFGSSVDSCVTVVPYTVGGSAWASFTGNFNEASVRTPTRAGISHCMVATITSGTLTYDWGQ